MDDAEGRDAENHKKPPFRRLASGAHQCSPPPFRQSDARRIAHERVGESYAVVLRGVIVGESFIVNVLERIVAEIPIEFAGCTVVVLPARMASLSQIIEKIEQLLLSDRELTRDIDGASLPVGIRDAFDAA